MRKIISLAVCLFLAAATSLSAQDSIKDSLKKAFSINDYTLVGIEYGASVRRMQLSRCSTMHSLLTPTIS